MLIREILSFISLGVISFFVLFLCLIPSLVYAIKYVSLSITDYVPVFLVKLFYYMLVIVSMNMATFIFIPALIFRIFRIRPKEGEYDLTPLNRDVYKWYLSLGLYKISMIVGRVSHITRGLVIRLFGGKIGRNVYFQGHVTEPYFLDVGDYTVVGDRAKIFTHIADKPGRIMFRRVRIGKYCLVGYGALIMPGSKIGDYVILGAYSIVPKNSELDNGVWVGSPARKIREIKPEEIQTRKTRVYPFPRSIRQKFLPTQEKQKMSSDLHSYENMQ